MSRNPHISVIIPSNHGHNELLKVVNAICIQTLKAAEIVIVDSSGQRGECPKEVISICTFSNVRLIYVNRAYALPGHARNIGLDMAKGELIAFIDVQTIPRPQWLEVSLSLLTNNSIAGVWGATNFRAETAFERLVRDGFHGTKSRSTLPGTVCRRGVFTKTGRFIDWVRAGEDTEWMLRLELLKVPIVCPSSALIDYLGLIDSNMKGLLIKWYRNYTASRDLPHFFPQRLLLWLVLLPFSYGSSGSSA
jgi:glycosyltransferase involved in cell wall biosynthesis